MSKEQKNDPQNDREESIGDRWLYNGVVFFLVLPITLYLGWTSSSLIGYLLLPGFGGALTIWRVAVTPEIRNRITLNFIFKSKKQVVKYSPGASLKQAENFYEFNLGESRQGTAQLSAELVKVYISLRKEVRKWEDPRWSGFREWKHLDEEQPHLVSQIKKAAPDLFELCNQASTLFEGVYSLRYDVGNLVRDEQERLAQEFQSRFDDGEKVTFSMFRIKVDGGNERPLYLEHAWANEKGMREWAETFAHEVIFRYKTWELDVVVTGKRMGNVETRPVANGDEAIALGDRVLGFLKTQQTAMDLQRELRKTQELRKALLSRIEEELSKA